MLKYSITSFQVRERIFGVCYGFVPLEGLCYQSVPLEGLYYRSGPLEEVLTFAPRLTNLQRASSNSFSWQHKLWIWIWM